MYITVSRCDVSMDDSRVDVVVTNIVLHRQIVTKHKIYVLSTIFMLNCTHLENVPNNNTT